MPEHRFSRKIENMIADLRGVPRDISRSRIREPKTSADLMDRLLHKYRIGMATPEEAIRDAWVEIVGEPNAAYCHPDRIARNRQLVVAVSNPVIRQELLFHKATILKRIQAIPACHHLKEVAFRAG